MAIANPRIHMICGICGCNKMLKFRVKEEKVEDENDELVDKMVVSIICGNCASLTDLDEICEEEIK